MQDLTISLVQAELAWEDKESNLCHFEELISGINESTDLIVLPEMFNTGFTMDALKNAEEMDGMTLQWMANVAHKKNVMLIGSMIMHEDDQYFNRLVCIEPDGNYKYYDKKHLFRMGDEHKHYTAGNKRLVIRVKGWKIMPLVCYDLRFPVWSKNAYRDGKYEYDLLIYIANWPTPRIQSWRQLIIARAIENMAYAAGVNRIGHDGNDYEFNGQSLVATPEANVAAQAEDNKEEILNVTLQAGLLQKLRDKLGVGKDWDSFEIT